MSKGSALIRERIGTIKASITQARSDEEWIQALSGTGSQQDEAINDLRQLLLRAALFTLSRYLNDLDDLSHSDRLALAEESSQEALIAILGHLSGFRGDSKFTTWAYKFAINISLAHARREGLRHFSRALGSNATNGFDGFASNNRHTATDIESRVMLAEVIAVLEEAIQHDLTDRQRQVLSLNVFEHVPMDGVVQHLQTNRNAVYKLLYDARKKLKRALQAHGFEFEEIIRLFGK